MLISMKVILVLHQVDRYNTENIYHTSYYILNTNTTNTRV